MSRLTFPGHFLRRFLLLLLWGPACALAQSQLTFQPDEGPVGTRVEGRASGLPANTRLELVWHTVAAQWQIEDTLYKGVKASPLQQVLQPVVSDARGEARFSFTIPEDYGHIHNLTLAHEGTEVARQGFIVVPAMTVSPRSGPPGTPFTVRLTGLGYRFYDRGRHLYYDQKYVGWLTAIGSKGTAVATVRASGNPGPHLLELINGPRRAYLNGEQSPNFIPSIPFGMSSSFTITRGPRVQPPSPASQSLPREPAAVNEPPAGAPPQLQADFRSGTVGSPIRFSGSGFPAGSRVTLTYRTVRGNRIGGGGWDEADVPAGKFPVDAAGRFRITLPTPDDLEGNRVFTASSGDVEAQFAYRITPSIAKFGPLKVKPGGELTLNLKGTGWTSTGNIYTLLLDNSYVGYACGFNSHGDILIKLRAPLQRGWHTIDLYPSIYEGKSDAPTTTTTNDHFQLPMLHVKDHPGENLPAFHLAFEVK